MKIDKNLFSRSTQAQVLRLLRGGERRGAELIAALEAASCQVFRRREAFLYPVLHYLERKGLVRAELCERAPGRKRFCYALTGKGRRCLAGRSGSACRDGTLPSAGSGTDHKQEETI